MILVRRLAAAPALTPRTRTALAKRQSSANAMPPRDPRIGTAWAKFLASKPRTNVANALDQCFRHKCAYCEGVAAQDIEHFYPKTLYPDRMFDWDNFLRGCKNCNNFKRDQFPLLPGNHPELLDPCRDDPLDYFVWDDETGETGVRPDPAYSGRGQATRTLFRLNIEPLREERRIKLALVLFLLSRVVNEAPVSAETQNCHRDQLDQRRPWLGIIRQHFRRSGPTLAPLVNAARAKLPDIDQWTAPWL